jgi:hypothetical protein
LELYTNAWLVFIDGLRWECSQRPILQQQLVVGIAGAKREIVELAWLLRCPWEKVHAVLLTDVDPIYLVKPMPVAFAIQVQILCRTLWTETEVRHIWQSVRERKYAAVF